MAGNGSEKHDEIDDISQPHTFVGEGNQLFMQRVRDFFDRALRGGGG